MTGRSAAAALSDTSSCSVASSSRRTYVLVRAVLACKGRIVCHNILIAPVQWDKFLSCSSRPNAASEADVNTYISEYREAPAGGLAGALGGAAVAEAIVADLDEVFAGALELGDGDRV